MKLYLNKGLLYKEWKTSKWFLLFYGVQSIITQLLFNNHVNTLRELRSTDPHYSSQSYYWFGEFFDNANFTYFLLFTMTILFATTIVGSELSGRKYETLNTLPYKREEIIFNKWFTGIMTIITPLFLNLLSLFATFGIHYDLLKTEVAPWMIFRWFTLNSLMLVFIFSIIMLFQIIAGKNFFGGILGSIFLFIVPGVTGLLVINAQFFYLHPSIANWISSFNNGFEKLFHDLETLMIYGTPALYNLGSIADLPPFPIRILVLSLGIVISLGLSIYAFKRYKLENIGHLVAFEKLEVPFKFLVSSGTALLTSAIAGTYIISTSNINYLRTHGSSTTGYIILNLFILIGSYCLTYFLTGKIIKATKN